MREIKLVQDVKNMNGESKIYLVQHRTTITVGMTNRIANVVSQFIFFCSDAKRKNKNDLIILKICIHFF